MARAFIISLIGGVLGNGKRDKRGEYADLVFDRIIAPAFKALEAEGLAITALRGDHNRDKPNIFNRILDSLVEDDIIIAMLSEPDPKAYNPNVFLELGAGWAIGRPVLMLKRIEQAVPFDVQVHGDEFITYTKTDLKHTGPGLSAASVRLAADVRRLLQTGETYVKPFGRDDFFGRLGARDRFFNIKFNTLSSIILDADKEIWLAGTTLGQLLSHSSFHLPDANGDLKPGSPLAKLLAVQIGRGVNVTVMITDPDHPMLDYTELETPDQPLEVSRAKAQSLRKKVRDSLKAWYGVRADLRKALAEQKDRPDVPMGTMRILRVRRSAILDRVLMTDKRLLFTPNMHFTDINSGPCVDARPKTEWYDWVHSNLAHIAALNPEAAGDEVIAEETALVLEQKPEASEA